VHYVQLQQATFSVALVICFTCLAGLSIFGQETPTVSALFQQLADARTTDQARAQLLKLCKNSAGAREYLVLHLPAFLANGPNPNAPETWANGVRLAGDLKIAEAAPVLEKWVGLDFGTGTTDLTREENLENNLPAKALAQIGDPAVPALVAVFGRSDKGDRLLAVKALRIIGSPAARSALMKQVDQEPDSGLQRYIRKVLENWKESS
jgi:hypothetical protein